MLNENSKLSFTQRQNYSLGVFPGNNINNKFLFKVSNGSKVQVLVHTAHKNPPFLTRLIVSVQCFLLLSSVRSDLMSVSPNDNYNLH